MSAQLQPPLTTGWPDWLQPVLDRVRVRDLRGAARQLKKLQKDAPQTAVAQTALGWAWLLLRDAKAARRVFQRAVVLDKDFTAAYHGWGHAAQQLGNAEEAEAQFKHATKLAPAQAVFWVDLGAFYFNRHNLISAEKTLHHALTLADNAQAHMLLGYLHYLHDDVTLALAEMRRAATLEPENPALLNSLAFLELLDGQIDAARAHLDLALQYKPQFIRARYGRALLYWLDGKRKAASDLYAATRHDDAGGNDFAEHLADLADLAKKHPDWERLADLCRRLQCQNS